VISESTTRDFFQAYGTQHQRIEATTTGRTAQTRQRTQERDEKPGCSGGARTVRRTHSRCELPIKLRRDFAVRRIHPAIEALVWAYAIGKPKESLELSGQLDISQRLTAERDLLRNTLDAAELEALAAESQATLDRAIEAAKARRQLVAAPQDIVVQAEPAKDPPESLGSQAGSDM
jgi:hypothetical protein